MGPGLPILKHLAGQVSPSKAIYERVVKANWRYMIDISLDDYHIVALHPSTFGKDGYLKPENVHYARFGAHSAYLPAASRGAGGDGGGLRAGRIRAASLSHLPVLPHAHLRDREDRGCVRRHLLGAHGAEAGA